MQGINSCQAREHKMPVFPLAYALVKALVIDIRQNKTAENKKQVNPQIGFEKKAGGHKSRNAAQEHKHKMMGHYQHSGNAPQGGQCGQLSGFYGGGQARQI